MSAATNRTERLAKALKECRPDFTLHNARVFARAVIDSPDDVFGAKPLTFLPGRQARRTRTDEFPFVATDIDGPLPVAARVRNADEVVVLPFPFSVAEMYRPPASAVGGAEAPPSLAKSVVGDLVFRSDGTPGLYLGNGKMLVGDADIDAGERLAPLSPRRRDDGVDDDIPAPKPSTDDGSERRGQREDVASTRGCEIPRPPVPENGTGQSAAGRYWRTDFVLGVTDVGTPISWRPADTCSLAVIGPTGSGKWVVAESLLDQARAAGWMTLHATTLRVTRDPRETPGLVASTTPVSGFDERGMNEFSAVIDLARRIWDDRWNRRFESSAVLGRYAPDAPVLVVLEGLDMYLQHYRDSAAPGDERSAVQPLLRLLWQGRDHRVHFVVESQRWAEGLPDLWRQWLGAVVLAGMPEPALAKQIVGVRFPDDRRYQRGRMTWVDRRVDAAGGELFVDRPFQGYFGGPRPSALPGQYPRLALDTGDADLGERILGFHELAELPEILLDREVNGRWEPDPRYAHLDPWQRLR